MRNYVPKYKSHLEYNNYAQRTIESYLTEVEHYFSLYSKLSRQNILSYMDQIKHLKASSFNHHLSSLKSFNEFLLEKEVVDKLYINKKDFRKQQKNMNPTNVTNIQVIKFLQKINERNSVYKSRNAAIINLMSHTGIRREECTNILLKDLDLDNQYLFISRGKGNKEREIPIPDEIMPILNDYLKDRANHKFASSPYLFVSERQPKMTTQAINDLFKKYNTPKNKINPHALRHNFASSLVESGKYTLPEVQEILGHSSISTTGIYTHPRKSEIKKKMKSFKILTNY